MSERYFRDGPTGAIYRVSLAPREHRRAAAFVRMREEGDFLLDLGRPVQELSASEAREYLDDVLPAVASLAERVIGAKRSYYIGLTGNGGILIYLAPTRTDR